MGLIKTLLIITLIVANLFGSISITTRTRRNDIRRHTDTQSLSDWEVGLREATYHALLREGEIRHPHLKEYLYNAPLLGRQDTATPFGDIAIIARGQLYSAPGGFQFVQDPYQNDCDGCHNTPLQCDRSPCEYWRPQDHERLLALWTIKRIRHRDRQYGFKYDFEYKVSPMSAIKGKFITRNGNFDYGISGHKFIIQKNPSAVGFADLDGYPKQTYTPITSYDPNQWTPYYNEPNRNAYLPPILPQITEDYYDEDPRNQPYGPNGYTDVSYQSPTASSEHTTSYTKDIEHDLYNNAISTLTTKYTTRQVPASTIKATAEADFLFPKREQTSYTQVPFLPTNPNFKNTPLVRTTKVQFPTSTSSVKNFSESTQFVQYSEVDPLYTTTPATTSSVKNFSESMQFVQYSEVDPLYTTTPVTTVSKTYFTNTNQQRKPTRPTTTENDYNVELFGEATGKLTKNKFDNSGYNYMGLGEQAITVVTPPSMSLEDALFSITKQRLTTKFSDSTTDKIQSPSIPSDPPTRITTVEHKPSIVTTTTDFEQSTYLPTTTTQKATSPLETQTTLPTTVPTSTPSTSDNSDYNTFTNTTTQMSTRPTETTTHLAHQETTTLEKVDFDDFTTEANPTTSIVTSDNSSSNVTKYTMDFTESIPPSTRSTYNPSYLTTILKQYSTIPSQEPPPATMITITTATNPHKSELTTHPKTDYEHDKEFEDEIFNTKYYGKLHTKPTIQFQPKTSKSTPSTDLEDIFGTTTHDGHEFDGSKSAIKEEATPEIIFSNFYLASTPDETTEYISTDISTIDENRSMENLTTYPHTRQSYITSVSIEVNKKQNVTSDIKPVQEEISNEVVNTQPQTTTSPDPNNDDLDATQSKKILETLTMSVLNHARSIKYLSNNRNSTSRMKYKQRIEARTLNLQRQKAQQKNKHTQ